MRRDTRRTTLLVVFSLLNWATSASAEGAWVLWEHSYEVWTDNSKENHQRDGYWKKVTATAANSDCDDRAVREARAQYYDLTGKGIGATLAGSEVGFDQSNTRYKRGYRRFECWPDTVDPRRVKRK